jgi:hypothetical protein
MERTRLATGGVVSSTHEEGTVIRNASAPKVDEGEARPIAAGADAARTIEMSHVRNGAVKGDTARPRRQAVRSFRHIAVRPA